MNPAPPTTRPRGRGWIDDPMTEPLTLAPLHSNAAVRPGRRARLAVVVIATLVLAAFTTGAVLLWQRPVSAPVPVAQANPALPGPSTPTIPPAPGVPVATASTTHPVGTATGCPGAAALVAVFRRDNPTYGTGAHAIGSVTCAAGFAVLRVTSAATPDGLSTIYRIGPPTRLLGQGTGPICTDDPTATDEPVVPHSAAATLHCATTSASPSPARTTSSTYPDTDSPAAHAGDNPYHCNDTGTSSDDPCSFHWPEGVGDGPVTIGQKWEACHWADDHARGRQYCTALPAQYR